MQQFTPTKIDYVMLPVAALTALLVSPIAVVATNIQDFQNIDVTFAILFFLCISVFAAFLGFFLSAALLSWRLVRTIASVFFRVAFFSSVLSTIAFPLAASAAQVEIQLIPVNRVNLAIVATLAMALTIVSYSRVQGAAFAAAFTVLAGSTVANLAVVATGITPLEMGVRPLLEASSKENIFVMSFDGVPRNIAKEVILENPEFSELLGDFVVFDELIGSAPATTTSIFSELSGIPNLKEDFDTEGEMFKSLLAERLMTNVLEHNGYKVSTFNSYTHNFANRDRAFPMGALIDVAIETRLGQVIDILDYGIARTATRHFARAGYAFREIAPLVLVPTTSLQTKLANHAGAWWDNASILTVLDFERYRSELSVATDENVAHFLHFTHTHFPVDFDETCKYRSDEIEWHAANQNRGGLKNQVYCAVKQWSQFIGHLKNIGAYDNALIVLKSDHGEPVFLNDPSRYEGFKVREHEYWGVGRYLPFLAVKPLGAKSGTIAFDSRRLVMSDLANTICRQTVSSFVDCDKFGAINLLDSSILIPDELSYFVYLPTGPDSTYQFDTHTAMELSRGRPFEVELIDKLTEELVGTKSACNVQVDVTGGRPNSNGLTDGKSWATWSNGGESFIKISPPVCGASVLEIALDVVGDVTAEIVGSTNSSPTIELKPGGRAVASFGPDSGGANDLAVTFRIVHSDATTPPMVASYIYQ